MMSNNLSLLTAVELDEIHFYRMDCLMRNKLKQLKRGALKREQVEDWFKSMPKKWQTSDDRLSRMRSAITGIRR